MDRREWQLPGDPGASLALGMVQDEGEALLHAAWWVTGTNWVLWGDWETPCSPGTGRGIPVPHPWGNSRMGFLCRVAHAAPKSGRHPQYPPIFISRDANTDGNTPEGGSHHRTLVLHPAPPTHCVEEETEEGRSWAARTGLPVPGW